MKKKSVTQKTLVILDAHAIIHRAYHALPSFTTSDGVPTGALYGVATMLVRIIEEFNPDGIVAAYDLPKPTFRHHAYDAYKKGRAKAEDDLVAQLQTSRELFHAFGVPCLDAEGFEADDVIGTLTEQYRKDPTVSIIIASGDMDTLQLVEGKKVQVYTLKKGVTDTILYDEDAVVARYGFSPTQLVDYKGLRGDPSDNIIGVPGVGEKTATAIVQTFGSIEAMYKALETDQAAGKSAGLSDRMTTLLLEHKDDALFSKTLATIRRDAPVSFAIPEESYKTLIDQETLVALIAKYEFRSLLPRVRKLFAFKESAQEVIDPDLLHRASIALWVLYSEQTAPTYEMILNRTKQQTLSAAYEYILAELKKQQLFDVYEKIEAPLIPLIAQMQARGILIDQPYFETLRTTMRERLQKIEEKVTALTGATINLNSPKQLSTLLFTTLALKPKGKQKASGAYSTNAEVLEGLQGAHPVIPLILEYREVQKLLTTYVEALLGHVGSDGRIHATFVQHGTTTGRFSSTDPNLQNIPIKGEGGKEIRHGFIAAPGHVFIGSDYSQIELRVLAIVSGDKALQEAFARGDDIHATVAASMFGVEQHQVTSEMRRSAKVINFGILYGMGVTALQKNLGTTREKAQEFYNNYFAAFPTIGAYLERTRELAKRDGYTTTLFGRRRYFPAINTGAPFLRAFAERMASNAPIQGAAADIIKIAIPLVAQDLARAGLFDRVHLVLQVHDELVYEVESEVASAAEEIIKTAMESVFERTPIPVTEKVVPLAVSIGNGGRLDELK